METGVMVQFHETSVERRRRMNCERMRRNREDPTYRAEEQRRQRERRKHRVGVSKATSRRSRSFKTAFIEETHARTLPETTPWATAQVRPIQELDTRAAFPPQETAVVEIPTVDGCPVLPSVVTLSVFAPVPSNITLVVVAGDAVRASAPCGAVPMIPPVAHVPSVEVRNAVHVGRSLNLNASGEYWYTNDVPPHSLGGAHRSGAVVKREM